MPVEYRDILLMFNCGRTQIVLPHYQTSLEISISMCMKHVILIYIRLSWFIMHLSLSQAKTPTCNFYNQNVFYQLSTFEILGKSAYKPSNLIVGRILLLHFQPVAYLGGPFGDSPPLWAGKKNCFAGPVQVKNPKRRDSVNREDTD